MKRLDIAVAGSWLGYEWQVVTDGEEYASGNAGSYDAALDAATRYARGLEPEATTPAEPDFLARLQRESTG